MRQRRSDYDVTDCIQTTDPAAVASEVRRIFVDLFRKADPGSLDRSFDDFVMLYAGENPGYHACEPPIMTFSMCWMSPLRWRACCTVISARAVNRWMQGSSRWA
jgi:hypothetical protein